jgi:hypothetical protein
MRKKSDISEDFMDVLARKHEPQLPIAVSVMTTMKTA